ncbi:MAG: EamA family transporter [Thermodesulfobacteriota bacterium]
MTYDQKWLPVLGLVVLTLIWGYNWVVMKTVMNFCGLFSFAVMRAVIASLVLFAVAGASGRSLSPGSFKGVLLLGLLQTTGFFGFSIWALVSGGAGKTAVLVYTMPFWVLVLACAGGLYWALAGIWNKYFRCKVQVDLLSLNAWQLLIGGFPLVLLAAALTLSPA